MDAWFGPASSPEGAVKEGYRFTLNLKDGEWSCLAMPVEPGKSGKTSYFMTEIGYHILAAPCETEKDKPAGHGSRILGW
jgi:hypothetical protein